MNGPLTTTPDSLTLCDDPGSYRAAFQAAPQPLALLDGAGRVLRANPALGKLLGTEPELLTGVPADSADALHLEGRTRDSYLAALRNGSRRFCGTHRLKHGDGTARWIEISVRQLPPEGEAVAVLAVTDVGERRTLQEQLRHLRTHDPVTCLPNRALFFERLSVALTESATGRIGLCYLDLDGFKAINDTLGHVVGDQLLQAVARRLARCAGAETDPVPRTANGTPPHSAGAEPAQGGGPGGSHLVARLGGDEFAVLVEDSLGTEQLTALAGRMLDALQRPFDLDGNRLALSASIGVVERGCHGTTPTDLMQAVDTTLDSAKDDGKDRWALFDPERNAHRMARQSLSARLRPAVTRGEFVVEYQPIVGLVDGRARGVEALVRWDHPELGRLTPDRFVALAEETGAIVPLGRWTLTEACRQARRWQRDHPDRPLFVSVNVAVRQVWDSDIVEDVAEVLEETGLPAGLLQLELTESAVMGSAGQPLRALQDLSERGVRIAIDDFGTGYSNLAYLSRLPVRTLKLDGTFVRSFRTARHPNPADETIVSSLVELAHKLGLTVTAECVEDPDQAERLRRIGCDTGQGWHYARAVPPERIGDLLKINQPLAHTP